MLLSTIPRSGRKVPMEILVVGWRQPMITAVDEGEVAAGAVDAADSTATVGAVVTVATADIITSKTAEDMIINKRRINLTTTIPTRKRRLITTKRKAKDRKTMFRIRAIRQQSDRLVITTCTPEFNIFYFIITNFVKTI